MPLTFLVSLTWVSRWSGILFQPWTVVIQLFLSPGLYLTDLSFINTLQSRANKVNVTHEVAKLIIPHTGS